MTHRIEAHILTTRMVTIMTTKIQTEITLDTAVDNEVYNLNVKDSSGSMTIAAISWFLPSMDRIYAKSLILEYIAQEIERKLPHLQLWCLIGNTVWQDDTSIIRYKKLFKMLRARGVLFPDDTDLFECMVSKDKKIKFFGAVKVGNSQIVPSVEAMKDESCSFIAALPYELDVESLISKGWTGDRRLDLGMLCKISSLGGLLIKPIGGFDDPESGFVGFGQPDTVKRL